jgi:hypothetical protein
MPWDLGVPEELQLACYLEQRALQPADTFTVFSNTKRPTGLRKRQVFWWTTDEIIDNL